MERGFVVVRGSIPGLKIQTGGTLGLSNPRIHGLYGEPRSENPDRGHPILTYERIAAPDW